MNETTRTLLDRARDALGARMTKDDLRLVLENTITYAAALEIRLGDVHRVPQDNVTPAEVRLGQYGERTKTWSTATYDSGTERALHEIACGLRDTLEETRDQRNAARLKVMGLEARVSELEARLAEYERPADEDPIAYALTEQAPLTVYRASHDSIPMGLYTTAAEARKHCETEMRRDLPTVALDWIEDEEDDVAELVASVGEEERATGYVVEALEVAATYDEEADE